MTTSLESFRSRFPEYGDLSDEQIARALFAKFRSEGPATDVTFERFAREIGLEEDGPDDAGGAPEEAPRPVPDTSDAPEREQQRSAPGRRPLSRIEITETVEDERGRVVEVTRRADEALADVDARIEALGNLMGCLAA